MALDLIPVSLRARYEVHEWKHACAILALDFPEEWRDILDLLEDFRLCQSWITVGGGNKSRVADSIDRFLGARGWREKNLPRP